MKLILTLTFIVLLAEASKANASPAQFGFELKQSQYLSESNDVEQDLKYTDLMLSFEKSIENPKWNFFTSLKLIQSSQEFNETYLTSAETYYRRNIYGGDSLIFGRKKQLWSHLDQFWQSSLWQPYFRWDGLHPEEQGLTGIFLISEYASWKVKFMYSPLFLPDQGPNIREKDGRIYSTNRWFANSLSSLQLGELESEIQYGIDQPDPMSIVNNHSVAVSGSFGLSRSGPWALLSLARKPMNQLNVAFESVHDISLNKGSGETRVVVHPDIVYHQLGSLELGWSGRDFNLFGSFNYEEQENLKRPSNWISRQVEDAQTFGWGVEFDLELNSRLRPNLRVSQIKRTENLVESINDDFVDVNISSLEQFQFRDALKTEVGVDLSALLGADVYASWRWIHALDEPADAVSVSLAYRSQENFSLSFGADIIGVEDPESESYLADYRGNDSVWGRLGYVF